MPDIRIRRAVPEDATTLWRMIRALAAYEHEPDAVRSTPEDLARDGFGPNPRFEALIAEVDGAPAGFALMWPNYSSWEGQGGLYLEDLFVHEWARGHGIGRMLMEEVARIAVERGYRRVDFNVLDWNPARAFYERLGGRYLKHWLPYRLVGSNLRRLAERALRRR